jgi:hypothetical protein
VSPEEEQAVALTTAIAVKVSARTRLAVMERIGFLSSVNRISESIRRSIARR